MKNQFKSLTVAEKEKKSKRFKCNRIKIVLAEQERNNKWLVEKLDVNSTTVSRWCTNDMQPTIPKLFRIAEALDIDVRELLVSTKAKN